MIVMQSAGVGNAWRVLSILGGFEWTYVVYISLIESLY